MWCRNANAYIGLPNLMQMPSNLIKLARQYNHRIQQQETKMKKTNLEQHIF